VKYKIAIIVLTFFLLIGCTEKSQTNTATTGAKAMSTPSVKVTAAQLKPIIISIKIGGTVEPKMQTWINAPAEGTIQSLNVSEGNSVRAGSVIGYVVSADQQNMLALAKSEYERTLQAASGDESQESVIQAAKRYKMAKDLYKPFPIVSPANGIVMIKEVEIGANVNIRQPLLMIADLQQMIVRTAVPEQYTKVFKNGQRVKLLIPVMGDKALHGTISMINPAVDIKSRTCGLEISVPHNNLIKPGMTAVCELVIANKSSALSVPQDAVVVKPNGDKIVFTVRDSTAYANLIVTGLETNNIIEILSGIKVGDIVVISGNENLKDKTKVKISAPVDANANKPKSE